MYAPPYDFRVTSVMRGTADSPRGVQRLGAAADHAVPLLADAGQVAGGRPPPPAAAPRRRRRCGRSRAAFSALGESRQPPLRMGLLATTPTVRPPQAAQADDHVGGPLGLELLQRVAAAVQDAAQQQAHVVGAAGLGREQGAEAGVVVARLAEVEGAAAGPAGR